jgi:hypothetical protein
MHESGTFDGDLPMEEAFYRGGWLLARQAVACAAGRIPPPLACMASPEGDVWLTESSVPGMAPDSLETLLAGLITREGAGGLEAWSYCYDADLGSAGRALVVEVAGRRADPVIALAQRYRPSDSADPDEPADPADPAERRGGFALAGEIEPIGIEFLSPSTRRELASIPWREWVAEGAVAEEPAAESWSRWSRQRLQLDAEGVYPIGQHTFCCPMGWIPRRGEDQKDWVLMRLVPVAYRTREPMILVHEMTWQGQHTVQDVLTHLAATEKADRQTLESEAFELRPGWPVGRRVVSEGAEDGRRFLWYFVPSGKPCGFILLWATVIALEGWELVERGCLETLQSLQVADSRRAAAAPPSSTTSPSGKWWLRPFRRGRPSGAGGPSS